MDKYIKVNLPRTMRDHQSGNGEGIWIKVDEDTQTAYDQNESGAGYRGLLANDSLYFPDLKIGMEIPFELRGENRPVADFPNFLSKLDAISAEEKMELIRGIVEHRAGTEELECVF